MDIEIFVGQVENYIRGGSNISVLSSSDVALSGNFSNIAVLGGSRHNISNANAEIKNSVLLGGVELLPLISNLAATSRVSIKERMLLLGDFGWATKYAPNPNDVLVVDYVRMESTPMLST